MNSLFLEMLVVFLKRAAADKMGEHHSVFALAIGVRPGEYRGLKWRDLDLERDLVPVQNELCVGDGAVIISRVGIDQ